MASAYSVESFKCDEIILLDLYKYAGYSDNDLPTLKKAVRRGDLAVESLVENAISKTGKLKRVKIEGMDFEDGSDAKKTTVMNQFGKTAFVRGAGFSSKNKKGILRVVVVEPLTKEVYYFKILPEFYVNRGKARAKSLRIPFAKDGGPPKFTGKNKIAEELWSYRVNNFKDLCK